MTDENIDEILTPRMQRMSAAHGLPVLAADYPLSLRLRGHITLDSTGKILHVSRDLPESLAWLRENGYSGAIIGAADGDTVAGFIVIPETS